MRSGVSAVLVKRDAELDLVDAERFVVDVVVKR